MLALQVVDLPATPQQSLHAHSSEGSSVAASVAGFCCGLVSVLGACEQPSFRYQYGVGRAPMPTKKRLREA